MKPKKEDYGWHTQSGFDNEPSGWQIEGGEEERSSVGEMAACAEKTTRAIF